MGFDIRVEGFLLAMEAACLAESVGYIVFHFILIARALKKIGQFSIKGTISLYFSQYQLVIDLLSISPFNIIFGSMDLMRPLLVIVPLRLLRVCSMFKIPALLNKIEFELIQVSNYITIAKTLYFLVYLWHWSSCMWFFINL
jgi:hypothetical protein